MIISALCLIGCSYQVVDISERYFSYSTHGIVSVDVVDGIHLPSVSVCWSLEDVLTTTMNMKENQTNRWEVLKRKFKLLKRYTIADIFKATPSVDQVFSNPGCAVKIPGEISWRHPWYNKSECEDIFNITRYIHRFTLCYKFTAKEMSKTMDVALNTLSPTKPGIIFMLFLDPSTFKNVRVYTAYSHLSSSSELFDSMFSLEKTITTNGKPYRIGIVSTPITEIRLMAPYDTKCMNFPGYRSGTEYIFDIMNKQFMKSMNYVHSFGHIKEPYNSRLMTPDILRNVTISRMIVDRLKYHKDKTYSPVCFFKYNIAKTRLEEDERLTIALNWPQSYGPITVRIPDQKIIDFIIYVCSSIGIWLGLSALSIGKNVCNNIIKMLTENEESSKKVLKSSEEISIEDLYLIVNGHSKVICDLLNIIKHRRNVADISR